MLPLEYLNWDRANRARERHDTPQTVLLERVAWGAWKGRADADGLCLFCADQHRVEGLDGFCDICA